MPPQYRQVWKAWPWSHSGPPLDELDDLHFWEFTLFFSVSFGEMCLPLGVLIQKGLFRNVRGSDLRCQKGKLMGEDLSLDQAAFPEQLRAERTLFY